MISRRKILKSALAAPFIIDSMRSSVLLAKGAGGALSGDYTSQVLAALAPGTWSSDIVVSGFHLGNIANTNVAAPGETCVNPANFDSYFPFSGGIYCSGKKRYFYTNTGGHNDFNGAGICYFDCTTGKWVQSETPTRYGHNPTDVSQCGGAGVGPYNGNAWPAESDSNWFCWPNSLGHFGAFVAHDYAQTEWCPELNFIHRFARAQFPGGNIENSGIWRIDADTGLWGQTPYQQYINGVARPGQPTGILAQDAQGLSVWIPELRRLFSTRHNAGAALSYDPIAQVSRVTHQSQNGATFYESDTFGIGLGCTIADPLNPGHRAYVYFAFRSSSKPYPSTEVIACYPKVDTLPSLPLLVQPINFGGTVPAPLQFDTRSLGFGSASHDSVWFEGAKYKPGSTKILVWHWWTGFWLLDMTTWTFTGPLAKTALPFRWPGGASASEGFRLIQPMPDYADANHLPFMIVYPRYNDGVKAGGAVFLYKFPLSLL